MKNTIKNIISFIIILSIFCSLFSIFIPTSSALFSLIGKVYECNSVIEIDYDDNATQNPFLPVERVLNIPIDVNYKITGRYANVVSEMYQEAELNNFIYLYVDEYPDWCSTSFLPPILVVPITDSLSTYDATLVVQVNENAPAFARGIIKVRIEVLKAGAVLNATFRQDIPFSPGYLPNIGITTQENLKSIGPQETANFDINVENYGNAKTNVDCKILDKPDGWTITIDPDTIIGTKTLGDDPKKTIILNVKPPYGFGYHDEREVITVSIIPSYFNDESLTGDEFFVSFIVQSRGFSTPGFEIIIFFIAFISVMIFSKKKKYNNLDSNKRGK